MNDGGCRVNEHRLDVDQSLDASVASDNLARHIQQYVDGARLLRTRGHELIFTLPLASADKFAGKLLSDFMSLSS